MFLRASLVLVLVAGMVTAADLVGVPGSGTKYSSEVEVNAAGKTVPAVLTGTAMRSRYVFNVYAVGSYLQKGVKVSTAEELASVDAVKRLHLVMERNVDGKDMAEAFRVAIRANYAEGTFDEEVTALVQLMRGSAARKGDEIFLTHIPGVGLHVSMPNKADLTIKNTQFTKAMWDIYLGKNNVGDAVKKGLVSRL